MSNTSFPKDANFCNFLGKFVGRIQENTNLLLPKKLCNNNDFYNTHIVDS